MKLCRPVLMKQTLNVLSYNLHKGRTVFKKRYNIKNLKEIIFSLDFDIGFFQEVLSKQHSTAKLSNQLEVLADEKWTEFSFAKNSIVSNHEHGNAILSKYPIIENHILDLTLNRLEKRSAIFTKIAYNGHNIICICTHLNLLLKDRRVQIDKILEFLSSIKNEQEEELVIFAGDFNDWTSEIEHLLRGKGFLTSAEKLNTFPSQLPLLPLDKIFYLNHADSACHIGSGKIYRKYSDHLPYISRVDF